MRALTRLYSCTWCFNPPSRNDAPSMNSVLVTMAPASDAFTSAYCPAFSAASAMTSSVSGTIASTDSTNSKVCDSGLSFKATKTTGTKTSNQSKGLWRISCSSGFMVSVRETGAVFGYSVEMPGLSPRNRAAAGLISRSRCAAMCGGRRWRM